MKHLTLAAALFAIGVTPAFADNERGLYLGGGVGLFNIEVDTVEGFDSDDTVYKVFAGWRFAPFIAVELDYLDLGAPEDRIQGPCRLTPELPMHEPIDVEAEISGVAPYLIETLPLGPLELFAKVGYYFYDIEINPKASISRRQQRGSGLRRRARNHAVRGSACATGIRNHRHLRSG